MPQLKYAVATSQTLLIELVDATTFLPKPGIAATDVTASYVHTRTARAAIAPVALGSATAAWTSGGWFEVDATNQSGLYRFDVPDAAMTAPGGIDTTATQTVVTVKATGCKTHHEFLQNTLWDVGTSFGRLCWAQSYEDFFVLVDDTMGQMVVRSLNHYDYPAEAPAGAFEGVKLGAAGANGIAIESGLDLRQAIQTILAYAAGVSSGAGTGQTRFKNPAGNQERIRASTPGLGVRSSVVLTND